MIFRWILTVAFSIAGAYCRGQSEDELRWREKMLQESTEDADDSEFLDQLDQLKRHPLNLNEVTVSQLAALGLVSLQQAAAIVRHRELTGPFIDPVELQSVEGMDEETARALAIYVRAKEDWTSELRRVGKTVSHDLLVRLGRVIQRQDGFMKADGTAAPAYSGPPEKFLMRYRLKVTPRLSAGLLVEKDPGERWLRASSTGVDFLSGHACWKGTDGEVRWVVGDYNLQFGQGLGAWTGTAFGKGANIAAVPRIGRGLQPYTSSGESSFLRGVAATVPVSAARVTLFLSQRHLDARLQEEDPSRVRSINESGLHRTGSEIAGIGRLRLRMAGVNVAVSGGNWSAGGLVYGGGFDKMLVKGAGLEDSFDFNGRRLANFSGYVRFQRRNFFGFGEAAWSGNASGSAVVGVIASLSPGVSVAILRRGYSRAYTGYLNQAIAESSTASNEKGQYLGIVLSPFTRLQISSYLDVIEFPWLRYRVDAPSFAHEVLVDATWKERKSFTVTFRYRQQWKEQNSGTAAALPGIVPIKQQNYRLEAIAGLTKAVSWRFRTEVVHFRKEGQAVETGILLYQDLLWRPVQGVLSGNFRFALFDTDSFNTAIYAFENDVLYSYSVPAYQNKGSRFYLNAGWKIRRGLDISARYASTRYTHLEEVGNGNDRIHGPVKSEIKCQMRMQF